MNKLTDLFINQIKSSTTLLYAIAYTIIIQAVDLLYVTIFQTRLLTYKLISLLLAIPTIPALWHVENSASSSTALTYGSTPIFTAVQILKATGIDLAGKKFIDLGSGRGTIVFTAALAMNMLATGVELQKKHIIIARGINKFLPGNTAQFYHDDLLKFPLDDYDVIFVANTCFPEFMELLLTKKLENLKINTLIVSLSSPLKSEKIRILSEKQFWFSWGRGTVYFQRII